MQAHDDNDDTGEDGKFAGIGPHDAADGARAGAQGDEHGGEAEHEEQRGCDRFAADARFGLGIRQPLKRSAGKINEIRRHQRQHAGREKAQHARGQRSDNRDIRHGALMPARSAPRKRRDVAPARM